MKHNLTPSPDHLLEKSTPTAFEFNGLIKVFAIPSSYENDLLHFLADVKPQFDGLVSENANQTARKIQFLEKVELSKPTKGEEMSVSSIQAWNPSMIQRYLKRIFFCKGRHTAQHTIHFHGAWQRMDTLQNFST